MAYPQKLINQICNHCNLVIWHKHEYMNKNELKTYNKYSELCARFIII